RGRFCITLLVQEQRLLKWSQQTRESGRFNAKQVQLSLELSFDLANAVALCSQFTHTSKLCERIEVVDEVRSLRSCGGLNDSLVSPAANGLFTQTEELFNFFD